jgi:hypothetical protein
MEFSPSDTRWIFGLAYAVFPALTLDTELVSTRILRHPIELFVTFKLGMGDFEALPQIGLMADYLSRTTERASPPLEKTPADGRVLWSVSGKARARYAISSSFRVFSSVGADFLLNRFDQVVAAAGAEEATVFSPSEVRPSVEAGFSVDMF